VLQTSENGLLVRAKGEPMTRIKTPKANESAPQFKIGDSVNVMNGDDFLFVGRVSFVKEYDSHLGDRRYRVLNPNDGTRIHYNGKSLRKTNGANP